MPGKCQKFFRKSKTKWIPSWKKSRASRSFRNLYLENQPIIRENFLNRLVVGNIKAKALQEEKKTGLIRMGEYKYWATALAARFIRSNRKTMEKPWTASWHPSTSAI